MNRNQIHLSPRLYTQRGSAILYALLVTLFMTFAFYGVSTLVLDQNRETKSNEHVMKSHLALHSMIDYTILGLKKRWCFTDQWMPEVPEACNLAHPAAAERIVMGDDSARIITEMVQTKQLTATIGNPIQLQSIEKTILVSNFSAVHPIFAMVEAIKKVGVVKSIRIGIYRDTRASLPQQGREVYLKITTALLDEKGEVITLKGMTLQATSYVGVYPRELSGFALILPGNLYLDRKSAAGLGVGDNFFHQHDSRAATLGFPGISFDSPVFVNGDVILPPRGSETGDTVYTPVSFNDRIVLGAGRIKQQNNALYKTRTQGADGDQLWVQNREFGGFVKGVDIDGVSDAGLNTLAGIANDSTSPDLEVVNKCIDRNKKLADLKTTDDSMLVGRREANAIPNEFTYRLFLTQDNRFNRQNKKIYPRGYDPSKFNSGTPYASEDEDPVIEVRAYIGGEKVISEVADKGGYLVMSPKVDLTNYINKLNNDINNTKASITNAVNARDAAEDALKGPPAPGLYEQLSKAESDLSAEKAKGATAVQSVIDSLTATIADLKGKISTQENNFNKAKADIDSLNKKLAYLQAELSEAIANKDLKPVIRVEVEKTMRNGSYRDFNIQVTHPGALRNNDGSMMSVRFEILAFDVSYYRGKSQSSSQKGGGDYKYRDPNLTGQIKMIWTDSTISVDPVFYDASGNPRPYPGGSADETDWDAVCSSSEGDYSTAFEGADWNISFVQSVRHSWDFTGSQNEVFIWNQYNAVKETGTAVFMVKSIAKECRVQATADFVAGFYTCDHFIIEPRTKPLRIVGTIIAVKMTIDPTVYKAGLRWSSVFSPMSVYELREAGILRSSFTDVRCEEVDFPLWHPYPSQIDLANASSCNPISLRSAADPFTWTTVDPDCGVVNSATKAVNTTCKNRLLNFNVIEISRDSEL